jgi:hypothetical protein
MHGTQKTKRREIKRNKIDILGKEDGAFREEKGALKSKNVSMLGEDLNPIRFKYLGWREYSFWSLCTIAPSRKLIKCSTRLSR